MLLPIKVDLISKKRGCKQNFIEPGSFNDGKIVLALLTKIVAFYIRPTSIDIREPGFELIPR